MLGVTFVVAVCGYRLLDKDRDWLDAIYMVVITISSVGFGEHSESSPQVKLFTIGVIVVGMMAAAYTIGGLLQMLTEGEIQRAMGVRRMTREIAKLDRHIIICGFGRIGTILAEQLSHQGMAFVVVERDSDHVQEAQHLQYAVISGDATEEDVLVEAGIDRAQVLVTALPSDADNVFITLTSRNINKNLLIIARGEHPTTQKKLLQAGANRVVQPAIIGGQLMATLITRPSAGQLMELVADTSFRDVALEEFAVKPSNPVIGKTVRDIDAGRRYGLLMVAVKKSDERLVFNPTADYKFDEADTVIMMGEVGAIGRFRRDFA